MIALRRFFVNSFIGQASRLSGRIVANGPDTSLISLALGHDLTLPRSLPFVTGTDVVVTCRPEEVTLAQDPGPGRLAARLIVSMPLGPTLVHDLELTDGSSLRVSENRPSRHDALRPNDHLFVEIDTSRCHVFPSPRKG